MWLSNLMSRVLAPRCGVRPGDAVESYTGCVDRGARSEYIRDRPDQWVGTESVKESGGLAGRDDVEGVWKVVG